MRVSGTEIQRPVTHTYVPCSFSAQRRSQNCTACIRGARSWLPPALQKVEKSGVEQGGDREPHISPNLPGWVRWENFLLQSQWCLVHCIAQPPPPLFLIWLLNGSPELSPRTSENAYCLLNAALPPGLSKCFAIQLMRETSQMPHAVDTAPDLSCHPPTVPFFFSFLVPMTLPNLSWTFGGLAAL